MPSNREFIEELGYIVTNIKELVRIDCYWLAVNKYPMLSKANIFEVEINFNNKKDPIENDCVLEWIDIENCINLLPLPYHKKALEYYISKKGI